MREIKFRGLRTDGKGWVYGVPFYNNEERVCFIIDNMQTLNFTTEDTKFNGHEVVYKSVGQFTGLVDRNGTDIYEGDIVYRSGVDKCIIEWRKDRCKYDFKYNVELMTPQWMGGIDPHYSKTELEVTGNIHENN